MNTLSKTNYILLCLCLWLFSSFAYTNDTDSEQNPHQTLLELSVLPIILSTSPAIIDNEIDKLKNHNIKLKKKQGEQLKNDLLARFHPEELERQVLQTLQHNPDLDNKDILAFERALQKASLEILLELPRSTLSKPPQPALLDYHKKLEQQAPQSHRLSLIAAFDGLEHQSLWQAALVHHIQKAILASLNRLEQGKFAKHYHVTSIDEQREPLSSYNRVILLYAFRKTPSLDIVPYLDTLDKPANKRLFEALDLAFTHALDYRTNMALIVKP